MNDLLNKMIIVAISKEYCEGNETIQDLVNNYKKYTHQIDLTEGYKESMCKIGTNIQILSDLICMKKLENNRDDLLPIIELLENEIVNLKAIVKEAE